MDEQQNDRLDRDEATKQVGPARKIGIAGTLPTLSQEQRDHGLVNGLSPLPLLPIPTTDRQPTFSPARRRSHINRVVFIRRRHMRQNRLEK